MGRKPIISRERLLETGLQMIIQNGYESITVQSLAATAGCSTQPISWHFGNIEGYRRELQQYAMDYMHRQMLQGGEESYRQIGYVYVDMAIEQPHLIHYLRTDETFLQKSGGIGFIFDDAQQGKQQDYWMKSTGMTREQAVDFLRFLMIHTEGIVSLLLAGVLPPDKEMAHQLVTQGGEAMGIYLMKG